ncbi:hypothetical protein J3P96_07640 [Pseudomonas sp. R3-56]|uniref:hypothetical protein n=1 Tax=Pseudomonas sp. R3-56 TaxID=2817401 RepID=UPI003DA8BDBB
MSESANASNSPMQLLAPRVEELLEDIPGGQINLLPEASTHADLKVCFELWENSDPRLGEESVELFLDGDPVNSRHWSGAPIEVSDRWVMLPGTQLRGNDGRHQLHYKVTIALNGESDESAPLTMTLDTSAPELAFINPPIIDPIIVEDGLSEQYLIDNHGIVAVNVPTYPEPAPGDRIVAAWKNEGNGQQREVSRTLTEDDYEETQFQLEFDEALIRDMGDGPRSISYRVFDRAGNESPESDPVSFLVAVLRAPHYVPYPWIAEAEGSPSQCAQLEPRKALNGATAQIPEDAVYYHDDVVSMQFGEPGTTGAVSVPVPWGQKAVKIPAANIAAMFNKDVPMYYGVKLADGTVKDSETLTVQVEAFNQFPPPQLELPFTTPVSKAAIPDGGLPVHQKKWLFISEACLVTVKVSGVGKSLTVLDKHRVVAAEVNNGVKVKLPRDFMLSLPIGNPFIVETRVSFDDGGKWLVFDTLRPMLRD